MTKDSQPGGLCDFCADDLRVRHRVAEILITVERPNHFFGGRFDFNQQWVLRPGVTVADHIISAGKHFDRCHPTERNARQIVLMQGQTKVSEGQTKVSGVFVF